MFVKLVALRIILKQYSASDLCKHDMMVYFHIRLEVTNYYRLIIDQQSIIIDYAESDKRSSSITRLFSHICFSSQIDFVYVFEIQIS